MSERDFMDTNARRGVGVADWHVALNDIPALIKQGHTGLLGVIAITVQPPPPFFRLAPESVLRLRQQIVERLMRCVRPVDRFYSIGLREGLVILPELRSSATLVMAMLKFRQQFEAVGIDIDGVTMHLDLSCGAALYPDDGVEAWYLVQSARIACLIAGRRGLGYALYEADMDTLDVATRKLDQELRTVLTDGAGLELHLQPQVDALSGRCVGAEALLRWRRAAGEFVPPPAVLAAIERLGMHHRFNEWLFLTTGRIYRELAEAGAETRLSINISANDLLDIELPDLLEQSLKVWNVEPRTIQIEITETSMVQETEIVRGVLHRLRGLGLGLAVDDFGTGFSSMSNLKNLPVQEVKIDQSFIRNLMSSKRDQEITDSMIRLSHRLGFTVVAEGVETERAARLLTEMGCDRLQGFLFSPAMPREAFIDWYKRHSTGVAGCPNAG